MSYSTPAEVRAAAFPDGGANPQNPPTGTAADLDDTALLDAIGEADATIDSYLAGTVITPVVPIPPATAIPHPIDWWSRNIALYLATLGMRGSLDFTDNDPVARRYNATIVALTAIRDGKAQLPPTIPEINSDTTPGANIGAGQVINTYPNAMFTADQFDIPGAVPSSVTVSPFTPGWPAQAV